MMLKVLRWLNKIRDFVMFIYKVAFVKKEINLFGLPILNKK